MKGLTFKRTLLKDVKLDKLGKSDKLDKIRYLGGPIDCLGLSNIFGRLRSY